MNAYFSRDQVLTDHICCLACNLDDMTGEAIGYAMEVLWRAGALDVYTVPIGMKHSRPGTMLCCLCKPDSAEEFARLLLAHTTTLGVRLETMERRVLPRTTQTIQTSLGPVRVKCGAGKTAKAEYADLTHIAAQQQLTLQQVQQFIGPQLQGNRIDT